MIVEIKGSSHSLSMLMIDESRAKAANERPERVVLICFGAPAAPEVEGRHTDYYLGEFAKRLSSAANALVAVLLPSGVGTSLGTFSPLRWKQDLLDAVEWLCRETGVSSLYLVGYELITQEVLSAAADSEKVAGAATISTVPTAAPYGLSAYELSDQLEALGVAVPSALETVRNWSGEFAEIDPAKTAGRLGRKPWLVVHGVDDPVVPAADIRHLLEEVAGAGELHTVSAAGESLRADPRVLALLVGWLDRISA